MKNKSLYLEIGLLAAVLLAAGVFRFWQLNDVPPGLHYDEAIDLRQAFFIRDGARPIFVSEGWGREAMFYYFVAGALSLTNDNQFALRGTAAFLGVLIVLLGYLIARRLDGPMTAWFTAGWLAVVYWSVSTSRVGVRNITLGFMIALTVAAFWRAWETPVDKWQAKLGWYTLSGVSLGLTLYTYQPARFAPFIFVAFVGYLLLFHRPLLNQNWRGLAAMGAAALLTALPLLIFLANFESGEADRAWTIEPLTRLLAGDLSLVIANGIATLKMFTWSGDPLIAYNLPGRPVFVPAWTGIWFYAGLALALWRWRQPAYAFLLLWIGVMLAPTILTISAPHFNRTLAAQIPVMFLAALSITELFRWVNGRWGMRLAVIPVLLGVLSLAWAGQATWRDYFIVWPVDEPLRFQYNASVTEIARYLERDPDSRAAIVSNPNIEDVDPYLISVIMRREDLTLRYVNSGQALVLPAGHTEARLIVGYQWWADERLANLWDMSGQPIYQGDTFVVMELREPPRRIESTLPIHALSAGSPGLEAGGELPTPVELPLVFADSVALQEVSYWSEPRPGELFTLFTGWEVLQGSRPMSLSFFAHWLDDQGQLIAQQDGLGFPPHSWRVGDYFTQAHHLHLPPELPDGRYWLQLGLYRRETGERWFVTDPPVLNSDRLIVGPLEISR